MTPLYRVCHTLIYIAAKAGFQFRVFGQENVIEEGPAIMAANHQSYLDPPIVGVSCKRELYYMARKSLFDKPLLGPFISRVNAIPVDLSKGDLAALRTVIQLLKAGRRTLIFPEGTRSLDGQIQKARPGIGIIIAKTLAPVVPMRIFGTFEAWPKGGKLQLHPIQVVVGKPIRFSNDDFLPANREVYQKVSERVLAAVAALELPELASLIRRRR